MINKTYKFGIKKNEEKGYYGIILKDKTKIIFTKEGMSIMLPKSKKFLNLLNKQIKDKKETHVGITFSVLEVQALIKGMEELLKDEKDNIKY
jgi:predicted lactoylglutathione lyase